MSAFENAVAIWENLPRTNTDEIINADEFYDMHVMPLVAEKFLKKYCGKTAKYKTMFLTLGTSWQPLALSILLHSPERVIFLATEDVSESSKKIIKFVNKKNISYKVCIVDKGNSGRLLQAVKNETALLEDKKAVCIDITGGTKAMAAAAAMMAVYFNWDIFYIENDFLPVLRKPEPGTEKVIKMEKP